MDWIGLAQDRDRLRAIVNSVMNLQGPKNMGNLLTILRHVSLSGKTVRHGIN